MRYYRFKYVERILIRESRTSFHRQSPSNIWNALFLSAQVTFEWINWKALPTIHTVQIKCRNVFNYWMRREGGGGGVLKGSNMLISPAHAFCLDYAQQAQVVDPSIGLSHPVWRRKWFQGSSPPLPHHKPNSHISLSPLSRPADLNIV